MFKNYLLYLFKVNAVNPQTSCEQSKLPTSASKYDCLIKSFSMKLAQGKDVMKQGEIILTDE